MEKFAQRLKRLRVRAKLTQEGLALACGWSGQSRIANYETIGGKNSREPELDEIPVLARALNATLDELFGIENKPSQPARLDLDILREAFELAGKMSGTLTPDVLKDVYDHLIERDWKSASASVVPIPPASPPTTPGGKHGAHAGTAAGIVSTARRALGKKPK